MGDMNRRLVGIDGCPDGWLCVVSDGGHLDATILPDIDAVLGSFGSEALITIDVPIGLTDAGPRACDLAARKLLNRYWAAPPSSAQSKAKVG